MIEGVIRTRVGYGGGKASNPDYGHIGDHTETVQVDYDPRRITYTELLHIFWTSHRTTERAWGRQYMNAVFYHNEDQRQLALNSKAAIEEKSGSPVHTEVIPLISFTRAEDYHQKYLLNRRSELTRELMRIYPIHRDFVDSTAVARINGYVGGNGTAEQLSREIETLGLSRESQKILTKMVR